jgi:putative oxidoreductase
LHEVKKFLRLLCSTGSDLSLLPVRLGLGLVFMAHGSQKFFGIWGGYGLTGTATYMSKIGLEPGWFWAWLAAGGEWGGGLLVLAGLLTRFGALNVAVCMGVAMWLAQEHTFFQPEGVEYCLVLFLGALALLIGGGGRWSVDRLILRRLQ